MYSRLLRSIRRQPPDGSSQRHSLFELWLWGKMSKVQLNKYQTDVYFLELSHQMTNDCLLIFGFLLVFDCFCVSGT